MVVSGLRRVNETAWNAPGPLPKTDQASDKRPIGQLAVEHPVQHGSLQWLVTGVAIAELEAIRKKVAAFSGIQK